MRWCSGWSSRLRLRDRKRLKIVVDQQARIDGRGGQTLGHFRVLVTDDPHAATTATVPPAIREIARIAPEKRTPEQADEITKYFHSLQPELKKLVARARGHRAAA